MHKTFYISHISIYRESVHHPWTSTKSLHLTTTIINNLPCLYYSLSSTTGSRSGSEARRLRRTVSHQDPPPTEISCVRRIRPQGTLFLYENENYTLRMIRKEVSFPSLFTWGTISQRMLYDTIMAEATKIDLSNRR